MSTATEDRTTADLAEIRKGILLGRLHKSDYYLNEANTVYHGYERAEFLTMLDEAGNRVPSPRAEAAYWRSRALNPAMAYRLRKGVYKGFSRVNKPSPTYVGEVKGILIGFALLVATQMALYLFLGAIPR